MSKPELIVPIRDRRERKRILTLRNLRNAILVIAILFLAVTIQSDLRHPKSGEYGRLFSKQVSRQTEVARPKVDVIREAPVPDQTAADPLLVAPAAREQYLGVDSPQQPVASSVVPPPVESPHADLAIVSGPNGVTIARGKAQQQQPTLSGGMFRQ